MKSNRCKPGDLAVVVACAHTPELNGRFVVVLKRYRVNAFDKVVTAGGLWLVRSACGTSLLPCRSPMGNLSHQKERPIADVHLRPIRPDEGKDESLSWARPVVTEPA